jgi:hypothetical protein
MDQNLGELLIELGDTPGALPFSKLDAFSDLAGQNLGEFCSAWDRFPTAQRRRLAHSLVELAEASIQVNFDAVFRYCLGDPDGEVRAAAIDGLWENEDITLIGPLLTMLGNDPSVQVRAAAATGLGRFVLAGELEHLEAPIEARIVTELLVTIHLADETTQVRRRAVESVAYACMPEVSDVLEIAYDDDEEEMRLSAIVGMGRSCDTRWKEIVLAELNNASVAMRYEAVLACGGLALREAVPILSRLLDDADQQVREATIWSLGQIGGDQAKEALLAAYEDADEDTQLMLDEALAEHALAEGDLDFPLYELGDDYGDDLLDDELCLPWTDLDEEDDEIDQDDWDL